MQLGKTKYGKIHEKIQKHIRSFTSSISSFNWGSNPSENPSFTVYRGFACAGRRVLPSTNPSPNCGSARLKVGLNSGSGCGLEREKVDGGEIEEKSKNEWNDLGTKEQEHVLHGEHKEKDKREDTRDLDTIRTPCSATRLSNSADNNGTSCNLVPRHIITECDMEEFFSSAENEQQRQFIEKYNFDLVNEKPLPGRGRYEWVKVDP